MEDGLVQEIAKNASFASVLIVFCWRLPSIVNLFLESKKDVAANMTEQSKTFKESLQSQATVFTGALERISERQESRLEKVEETLKDMCGVLNSTQEAIKVILGELKETEYAKRKLSS